MNLKKVYTEKYGYERVVTSKNSSLYYAEADMLKLADGKSYTVDEPGKEFVLIVLYGKCSVSGEGFAFSFCFPFSPFKTSENFLRQWA